MTAIDLPETGLCMYATERLFNNEILNQYVEMWHMYFKIVGTYVCIKQYEGIHNSPLKWSYYKIPFSLNAPFNYSNVKVSWHSSLLFKFQEPGFDSRERKSTFCSTKCMSKHTPYLNTTKRNRTPLHTYKTDTT
jgi:hypothetical protein